MNIVSAKSVLNQVYPYKSTAIVVLSGGQDSTTCLYYALQKHRTVHAVMFDYGQKHIAELQCAISTCKMQQVKYRIIDIKSVFKNHTSSLLQKKACGNTDSGELPQTFVVGRNAIFLTATFSIAAAINAGYIYTGVSQVDYSGYPDCREESIRALQHAMQLCSGRKVEIITPLMHLTKGQTFMLAYRLDRLQEIIDYTLTCYNGDMSLNEWGRGCGCCAACELRKAGWLEFLSMEQ